MQAGIPATEHTVDSGSARTFLFYLSLPFRPRDNAWIRSLLIVALSVHLPALVGSADETVTIVAFGDSTTAPHRLVNKVYTDLLAESLAQHGVEAKVINSGTGSSHTGRSKPGERHFGKHALDRLQKDVLAHRPDIVIVQFGWNDSWIHGDDSGKSTVPVSEFVINLQTITKTLRRDGAIVILMTPNQPRTNVGSKQQEYTARYASAVRDLAARCKVPIVDVWKAYAEFDRQPGQRMNDLLRDRIHPNARGHALIATMLVVIIRTVVSSPKPNSE